QTGLILVPFEADPASRFPSSSTQNLSNQTYPMKSTRQFHHRLVALAARSAALALALASASLAHSAQNNTGSSSNENETNTNGLSAGAGITGATTGANNTAYGFS